MFVYILQVVWRVLLNFVVVDYFLFVQNLFVLSAQKEPRESEPFPI